MPVQEHPTHRSLTKSLKQLKNSCNIDTSKVRCIVVLSAHWLTETIKVSTNRNPTLLFDYFQFPPETYMYEYPAKGCPEVAKRILTLLNDSGIKAEADEERGFDHGVFIPLMLAFPNADIPIVSVSLHSSLSEKLHLEMGRALEPLRNDVLIIGSGMSYHNMQGFKPAMFPVSKSFSEYLVHACIGVNENHNAKKERLKLLHDWEKAEYARDCHPKSEHLVPLFVVAAAGGSKGSVLLDDKVLNVQVNSFSFS